MTCDKRAAGVSTLDMSSLIMTVSMDTVWSKHFLQMMMLLYKNAFTMCTDIMITHSCYVLGKLVCSYVGHSYKIHYGCTAA